MGSQRILIGIMFDGKSNRSYVRLTQGGAFYTYSSLHKGGVVDGTWDAVGRSGTVVGRVLSPHQGGWDGLPPWQDPVGLRFCAGDLIEFRDGDIVSLIGEIDG